MARNTMRNTMRIFNSIFEIFLFILVIVLVPIACTDGSTSHSVLVSDWRHCSHDEQCLLKIVNTQCLSGRCSCNFGFYLVEGEYYCAKVKLHTPCTTDRAWDSFCQSGLRSSVCSASGRCECSGEDVSVVNVEGHSECVTSLTKPGCEKCLATGGACLDTNDDGRVDWCACTAPSFSSNADVTLITGCDSVGVPTGAQCSPEKKRSCSDPHALCQHSGKLNQDHYCACKPGFVTVWRDYEARLADCYEELTLEVDLCRACIIRGGECYIKNSTRAYTVLCQCPDSKSSSTLHPEHACDMDHWDFNCKSDSPVLCYSAGVHPYHRITAQSLMTGMARLHVHGFLHDETCHLTKVENEMKWCIEYDQEKMTYCGVSKTETKTTATYSQLVHLERNVESLVLTPLDVSIKAYCSYNKRSAVSSNIDVKTKHVETLVGSHIVPSLAMSVSHKFTDLVSAHVLHVGDMIRLTIKITASKGVFNGLRAEVCIQANSRSLDDPFVLTQPLLLNGCPVKSGVHTKIYQPFIFQRDFLHANIIHSTEFPATSFDSESELVYFHCGVRVCLLADQCKPKACSRKRRSVGASEYYDEHLEYSPDYMRRAMDNVDYTRQVIGIRIQKADSHQYRPDMNPPRDVPGGTNEDVMNDRPSFDAPCTVWYTVGVVCLSSSMTVTMVILFFCFYARCRRKKESTGNSDIIIDSSKGGIPDMS